MFTGSTIVPISCDDPRVVSNQMNTVNHEETKDNSFSISSASSNPFFRKTKQPSHLAELVLSVTKATAASSPLEKHIQQQQQNNSKSNVPFVFGSFESRGVSQRGPSPLLVPSQLTDSYSLNTLSSNSIYPSVSFQDSESERTNVQNQLIVPVCHILASVSATKNTPNDEKADKLSPTVRFPDLQSSQSNPQTTTSASKKSLEDRNAKPSVRSSVQRWSKVRHTVAANAALAGHARAAKKRHLHRQDSFLEKFTTLRCGNEDPSVRGSSRTRPNQPDCEIAASKSEPEYQRKMFIICPQSTHYVTWLGILTLAVVYNLWTTIARQAFTEIREGYDIMWCIFDGLCDIVYILDIVVQLRTTYLEHGLEVVIDKQLALRYIRSKYFVVDLVSLTPLDLIQIKIGFHPILRFPRFLKVYRAWLWKIKMENRTLYPNAWRVLNFTHILFLLCHWFAGFYFLISTSYQFTDEWSYPKPVDDYQTVTRKYLRSLYWATLTLTTIGDLPPPEKNAQYVFTITSYLIGVFVFAIIVGQIGNAITNRNATRQEFEKILDNAKNYMRMHNVSPDINKRIMRWYDYAWARGRTSGGGDINALGLLPDKLKTELALHVNLETLKMVSIFHECRPEFLHDLVLKMRPLIFTPGDYICRKGEVAREMFIIADGFLEVISGTGEVLTQMSSGDFFGEIGILNLDGGINRRTADVKSVGYSELFVLSKEDVLAALRDHPDAEELITSYGNKRLQEIHAHRVQAIIPSRRKSSSKSLPFNLLPGIATAQRLRKSSLNELPKTNSFLKTLSSHTPFLGFLQRLKRRRRRPSSIEDKYPSSCFAVNPWASENCSAISKSPSVIAVSYEQHLTDSQLKENISGFPQSAKVRRSSCSLLPESYSLKSCMKSVSPKPSSPTILPRLNRRIELKESLANDVETVSKPLLAPSVSQVRLNLSSISRNHSDSQSPDFNRFAKQRLQTHTRTPLCESIPSIQNNSFSLFEETEVPNNTSKDQNLRHCWPPDWYEAPKLLTCPDERSGNQVTHATEPQYPLQRTLTSYAESAVTPPATAVKPCSIRPLEDSEFEELFQNIRQLLQSKLEQMEKRLNQLETQLKEKDVQIQALEKQLETSSRKAILNPSSMNSSDPLEKIETKF